MSKTFDEKKYQKNNQELVKYVIKYKAGDKSAFDYVYKYSEKYVYSVISKIVKSKSDVADVMQETYIKIYDQLDNLKTPETFLVWAGRIASNNTIDYMRKNNKEVLATEESEDFLFENASEDTEEFIPENVYLSNEKQSEIRQILDKLSDEQKLTIQLFYFEEYSVSEIAELTGVSTGTVKSRLNYARNSIKDYVKEVEEKKNIKLYSLSGLPLLLFFYGDINKVVIPKSISLGVRKVLAANKSVSAKMASSVVTKVVSGTVKVAVLGGVAVSVVTQQNLKKEYVAHELNHMEVVKTSYVDSGVKPITKHVVEPVEIVESSEEEVEPEEIGVVGIQHQYHLDKYQGWFRALPDELTEENKLVVEPESSGMSIASIKYDKSNNCYVVTFDFEEGSYGDHEFKVTMGDVSIEDSIRVTTGSTSTVESNYSAY